MERTRVWVFGYASQTGDLEENYRKNEIAELGEDSYVVIRADIVEDFKVDGQICNIVVPVDAKDQSGLESAQDLISGTLGVSIIKTVQVIGHIPDPPHISHGFITQNEIDKELEITGEERSIESAGRQHASPGSNKWG
ncbi:MAG: hypothetical protein ACK2U3_17720 [Anaerolineales bacterium]|jgi:hypothetical protein